jgi:hypothetical protein
LLTHTSIEDAPWYVVPADHKWFARAAVADVLVARLEALGLAYPSVTSAQRSELLVEREKLVRDEPGAPASHTAARS